MKDLKGTKTEQNLMAAFAGESQARVKYEFYAKKAQKDGYQQIADFFEETSRNEQQHAKIWFKLLHDGIQSTPDNLLDCVAGENYEWVTMYADFAKEAKAEGFDDIARLFEGVGKIEKDHEERYQRLYDNIKGDKVFAKPEEKTWICAKCGNRHTGKTAPNICPICDHPQAYYSISNEDY
ncbi:rubrerythrin family protein [Erysipelotrichaceae bacterium OttesenSCG-928-M19]|nr:rubrerythrin family protein [Erysipelotrichaceae bacterium OttesenSCG-928-M19]